MKNSNRASLFLIVLLGVFARDAGAQVGWHNIQQGHQAGRGWVYFNDDNYIDYCRIIERAPAFLACTLGVGYNPGDEYKGDMVKSEPVPPRLLGIGKSRAWVDFNGDGLADFCRAVMEKGAHILACTLSRGNGFGATVFSGQIKLGNLDGAAWTDQNGDGFADYCRSLGQGPSGHVRCTLSAGKKFGETIVSENMRVGIATMREWGDVNEDGRSDYCRTVEIRGEKMLQCTFATEAGGFGETNTVPLR